MLVAKVWERGSGEFLFNGYTTSDLQDKKTYGDRWWRWLYQSVNVLHTTELYA